MHRRTLLAGIAASGLASAARADEPKVFMNYTQKELDDAYTQLVYAPNQKQVQARYAENSAALAQRIGPPKTLQYGSKPNERILYYPARRPNAPLFVFIHGGAWHFAKAEDYMYPAEIFLNQGIGYAAISFDGVDEMDGHLEPIVDQICRAIRFTRQNTAKMGVDPQRLTVGGHSSGGHFAGVALTTDWQTLYGISPRIFRNALILSGMYDMRGPRLSVRSSYVKFTDENENSLSAQRHIDRLVTPLILMTGTLETPEFQRQSRDFAAAVTAAGKRAELRTGRDYNHFEMCETLGNPYAIGGRAALELCKS